LGTFCISNLRWQTFKHYEHFLKETCHFSHFTIFVVLFDCDIMQCCHWCFHECKGMPLDFIWCQITYDFCKNVKKIIFFLFLFLFVVVSVCIWILFVVMLSCLLHYCIFLFLCCKCTFTCATKENFLHISCFYILSLYKLDWLMLVTRFFFNIKKWVFHSKNQNLKLYKRLCHCLTHIKILCD
jgi:hypothetical protein